MLLRYPAALALTLALIVTGAAPVTGARPRHATVSSPRAGDLYSQRALRRAKIILQLKLLELRSEHLERVRRAIEKRIPIDELLKTYSLRKAV